MPDFDDVLEGPCEAGYPGCEGVGELMADPYAEDVCNETDLMYLCGVCVQVRVNDI